MFQQLQKINLFLITVYFTSFVLFKFCLTSNDDQKMIFVAKATRHVCYYSAISNNEAAKVLATDLSNGPELQGVCGAEDSPL